MEPARPSPETDTSEKPSSPLMTGFWLGFWSLLLLIIGSWFVRIPLIDRGLPLRNGRVSLFREAPPPSDRGVAGRRSPFSATKDR